MDTGMNDEIQSEDSVPVNSVETNGLETPAEASVPETAPVQEDAPAKPVRSRTERREQAAADALRGLIRDYLLEKCPDVLEQPEPMTFTLKVELIPGEPGEMSFTPHLRKQLGRQVQTRAPEPLLFEEGAMYDFQEEKTDCRPSDPSEVFSGYDNMGRPQWTSYTQVLLDARDPDVDQLHVSRGRPLVRHQRGKDLKSEQLGSFGKASRTYSLLGQVTAGFYRLPPAFAKIAGGEKLAFSFQVVETRDAHGKLRLRLNTLAGGLLPVEVNDLLQDRDFRNVAAARDQALKDLARVEEKALAASAMRDSEGFQAAMRRIPGVLYGLRDGLEGKSARPQRGRGNERKPKNDRYKADLPEAGAGEFFRDAERNSWVLVGASGFAHAFQDSGRYVTSFPVNPGLIESRILSERWQLGHADAEAVLARVRETNA
jgi:hypothetical protein